MNRDPNAALWLPFTPNRRFKANPRMFVGAKGMYYQTGDGRQVLDGIAGLWCVNAGHAPPAIVAAIQAQAERLDFVSSFAMSHPGAFELADRIAALAQPSLDHVFFSNSGSEAVDTALKIARAYHKARGQGGRIRFIGRVKGYHGVGWGGLSVSGIGRHRRDFGPLLPEVDHLPLPYDPEHARFSRGQPAWGAHLADELAGLVQLNDASTIAAVIVEPVTGSGGVYPPPLGYLERLRALCDEHGILLIFDEVITAFGRLGAAFGFDRFGVTPDIVTLAKGLTNGAVPMGATLVSSRVFDAFMNGSEDQIEFAHGYTYSAHPLACAAALATLDVYRDEGLFERAAASAAGWEDRAHALRGVGPVSDIRNLGLLAGIDLVPRDGRPGARAADCSQACFDAGVLVRTSGDTIMLSPPLTISEAEMDVLFETIARALKQLT